MSRVSKSSSDVISKRIPLNAARLFGLTEAASYRAGRKLPSILIEKAHLAAFADQCKEGATE